MHQIGKLLHHTFVRAEVLLLGQNQAEVEDELIAVIPGRFHADRVAQYPVSICAHLNQIAAELLPGNHKEGDVGKRQEERLRGRSRLGPGTVSLSWIVVMGSIDYFITLLGVEFAVEYGPDHDESKL